ncbi:MAG: class I SAM-dependent methyltransferase [Anaerolineae bacterium]|nr:class I SAM-dependent methyltransferase [Anaerolineae bacterium]NUQ02752.1 class I SAM-dependent methyltransferase [Anaerolineae bacterium]
MPARNNTNSFYDQIARYYPLLFRDWEVQMEREGLGLRSIFRNQGVSRILDASCGAGAQAIPLAQLGYEVTAADPSPGMLKKAAEFARQYSVEDRIHFVKTDFIDLHQHVEGPFDAIISKGNALPHVTEDAEIEASIRNFHRLLRPGGFVVIGMRDFGPFMEDRPRFLPGRAHRLDDGSDFITFDLWEWRDGPPVLARQNLFIVQGKGRVYQTERRRVIFRPLSTDEVKVVLLEVGFVAVEDQFDRSERMLVARKPG